MRRMLADVIDRNMAFATRDGVRIHWEQQGDAGDPLLLLMGLGCPSDLWERQTPAFARRHRTILVDNRGMGRSDKVAGPYSTAQMAEDALAVLDAAGVARAHVLGLSMGGMIAQELALAHPERVGALALACTFARPDRDMTEAAEQTGKSIDGGGFDAKQTFKMMMAVSLTPAFIEREKPWLRSLMQRTLSFGSELTHFQAQLGAVMRHDASARLPSLRAPTLVITGSDDKLIRPAHSDELHALIRGSTLVKIAGGPHGFNIEQPDEFNREVLAFFAQHRMQ
jgi:pimeloyl-ACP methyl ester carboxylesterase